MIGRFQYLANSYANGVGLALYRPVDLSTSAGRVTYEPVPPPGGMSVDDAVTRMCRLIKAEATSPQKGIPSQSPPPLVQPEE